MLCPKASVFCIAATIKLYSDELYKKGLDIITCATRRVNNAAFSPAVKSLNYLNNILAKIEANQANAAEALMLNDAGYIAECTADNVFLIKGGKLFTPPVSAGSLRGITRGTVLDLAAEIGAAHRRDGADPLRRVRGGRVLHHGHGGGGRGGGEMRHAASSATASRGPVTNRLLERFRHLTGSTGTPIFGEEKTPAAANGSAPGEASLES